MHIVDGVSPEDEPSGLLYGGSPSGAPNDLSEQPDSCGNSVVAEPIAIIGIGCRLPGGVNSASKLWDFLRDGKSGQCKVPPDRFNVDAFYHPKGLGRPGSMHTVGGYFLQEDPRDFEPEFFGINPLEATQMDPQQRKLLEVVFEAFESAGATLEDVSGANIGCYVGNFTYDFQVMQSRDAEYLHRYSATGMGATILGNRISHTFNLKGPSLVLDTACSSSLYSLHVACCALALRECDGAVVAGTNLIQSPDQHLSIMKAGVLSGTSTCHTFSTAADGYGRADGVGCLFIKRLADAIRDNDPIRGVIRGTAVNSNGKTPGITLPSSNEQEAVIRKAYARAGLRFDDTIYVECHGTGTPVGDPIEVEGISRVFSQSPKCQRDGQPLLIGSVKTNFGHSEAASGLTSVMKTVLAMEQGAIPGTIGVKSVNPKIKTGEWRISIVKELTPWPSSALVRRAGINSFGYGGANAHAIIESADVHLTAINGSRDKWDGYHPQAYLIPVSASRQASLERRVKELRRHISQNPVEIGDLVYTLSQRRSHLSNRGFFLARAQTLTEVIKIENLQTLPSGATTAAADRKYAFVFTGQGAQWPEMGKGLYNQYPIFANTIMEMDDVLRNLPDHAPQWTLKDTMFEPSKTSEIHDAARSQPICTALQVALVVLLNSWDIVPSAVVGHSSGEIAAAFAAGRISAAEAIIAAYFRGYAVGQLPANGGMMAVGLRHEAAVEEIAVGSLQGRIRVACVNSPESVTLSGDLDAVESLVQSLSARKLFARKLNTGGKAYHSHHMIAIGDLYENLLSKSLRMLSGKTTKLKLDTPVRWVSSVTGEEYSDVPAGQYWRANLENPVLFSDAVEGILKFNEKYEFIEIGPHSALEMPIKQIQQKVNDQSPYSSAMIRFKNNVDSILSVVGQLYLRHHRINWAKVNHLQIGSTDQRRFQVVHSLPPYPWTYEDRLWHESRLSSEFRHRKFLRHELLGSQVPGGNGLEMSWRNILKLADVQWLESHKLQETIVFPGAAYITMAVEAMRQIAVGKSLPVSIQNIAYKLRNVKILSALPISAQPTAEVELFTSLRPSPITSASVSKQWWDFNIVSHEASVSTTRATGTISFSPASDSVEPQCTISLPDLEPSEPRVWYKSLVRVGLNFGPDFQSIESFETPSTRNRRICRAKAPFIQDYKDEYHQYIIHPITLDAMLQTSIVASCSGEARTLHAKVPVSVGEILIQTPNTTLTGDSSCHIESEVRVVGFGTAEGKAELITETGRLVAQLHDLKMVPYNGVSQLGQDDTARHPMLRVLWKPDIHRLPLVSPESLSTVFEEFATSIGESLDITNEGLVKVKACLDWISHKHPGLRVMELGNRNYLTTNHVIDFLDGSSAFPRLQSYVCGHISDDGNVYGSQIDIAKGLDGPFNNDDHARISAEEQFDVVLIMATETESYLKIRNAEIKQYISEGGILLGLLHTKETPPNLEPDFNVVKVDLSLGNGQLILACRTRNSETKEILRDASSILIVDRGENVLGSAIVNELSQWVEKEVTRISLDAVSKSHVPPGSLVISLLEYEEPLLARSSGDDMEKIKIITDNAARLIWVTSGDLIQGSRPEFGLVLGLSRAVMTEQPSLKWLTFDIDDVAASPQQTTQNILSALSSTTSGAQDDYEFVQKDGVIYVSRFAPDDNLNKIFRQAQGNEHLDISVKEAKPVQLDIKETGNFDTIYFKQVMVPAILDPMDVQISLRTVSLNAKDYYVLGGKTETKDATCTLESCGVVDRVGSGVSDLSPGDRVVVMAPGFFRTSEIFPSWACQKLQDDESFDAMCTLPLVYATALYGLRDRANLQAGESVLIHSAAGGLGIAAINVARLLGAKEIFATVSSEEKRDYLVKTFRLKTENIFSSRDTSFLQGIMKATNGEGVNVVLNSLVGDLLHASWKCCSSFGRLIEVGKRDLVDCGKLEMEEFLRNVTFTAFDVTQLYYHPSPAYNRKWAQLLKDVLHLFRTGQIGEIGRVKIFDVSEITNAFRYFSAQNRIGKVVISLENPEARVRVRPLRYRTTFNPSKSYIMVGCLGGLGRSISRWMVSRGARKFVFLGRSGNDRPSAQRLISDLERQGAKCTVIRGDVSIKADVDAVVAAVDGKIGGVIQAAMGLHEALWTAMSNEDWHTSIDPKLTGTWNLHHAIQGKDDELEFFFMTSSISGSVGTATEANYCAANYFLDVFARYRRSRGLPANAVGLGMISEVGYLHENPDIEALLLRKGIQAINEDELIQIIDIALSDGQGNQQISSCRFDTGAQAHILTGLEPFGLKELRKQGWEGIYPTLHDPRAVLINRVLEGENTVSFKGHSSRLQADVLQALQDGDSPFQVILAHIAQRFSNLVLLPLEKVDVNKQLSSYGMDSMIAAEFRSWFYQAFQVDVPFLDLMGPTASIQTLSQTVFAEIEQELS
ncbi:uncharacterized protein Z518_01174 [Rhinocladiella mackenziei CBS 650.93]|uniref:Carrier domain-containing protein n=1 Tax=Rhinocladiella mackenziei CBS 650.93 TaxID=1442369 RepID=A0A0D2HHH0_9EURO|nr:uncharacterized protein Z518_01174 [Rhinocladiella mackenziei CBS 650.93]KIX10093.1 hypothetical protein Z518_01174 [Rhinocladiella mackenziei CBS 650.93]